MEELKRKKTLPNDAQLKEIKRKKDREDLDKEEREEERLVVLNLKMHENTWLTDSNQDVFRVSNGWIYSLYDAEKDVIHDRVFVPDNRTLAEKKLSHE